MKRILIIVIPAIIVLTFLAWRYLNAKPAQIKTVTVSRKTLSKTVSASGVVGSKQEVELKFQTSGLLAWVGVKEGDRVNAWQAIAQLDTRELQKNLEKYLRDYSKERNDFEEARRVTYGFLEPSQALTDTVKRILEKNQWDLEKSVLDVELKDIALKYATLITPIAGIVTRIDTPVAGVNITPSTAVFEIVNPDEMIFKANIDESDLAGIKPGMPARITLDAYPDKDFEAKVSKVSFASISTSGGGTAFPVEITLPENNDLELKIGLNGDADIIISKKEGVLSVPSEAITQSEGKNYVKKITSQGTVKVEVGIGVQGNTETEVTTGLNEYDKVIIQ